MATLTPSQLTPKMTRAWYALAQTGEIGSAPVKRSLFGVPVVIFREGSGQVGVLVDRCPHRNVPLSAGTVRGDTLECAYHGWRFGADGACQHIPALVGPCDLSTRRAHAYPVRESQGLIWVWGDPSSEPSCEPFHFKTIGDRDYRVLRRTLDCPGTLHSAIENALDVPHTAFLHGGLFRKEGGSQMVSCEVLRFPEKVECHYRGEKRPEGLIGKLLAPEGGELEHVDRFYLPSVSEVEYRLGDNHVLIQGAWTPLADNQLLVHVVISLKTVIPAWLVTPFLVPIAMRIFRQDAEMLQVQWDTQQAFGEVNYRSSQLDVLGTHILRLMRQAAEEGMPSPGTAPDHSTTIEMKL